jgi:hypothetical protein
MGKSQTGIRNGLVIQYCKAGFLAFSPVDPGLSADLIFFQREHS